MSNHKDREWYETIVYDLEVVRAGSCRAFHEKGQHFVINDYTTPKDICREVFHDLYQKLFSGKEIGKNNKWILKESDFMIYNCPSKEVEFTIQKFYQCNNCGQRVNKEQLIATVKDFEYFSLDILACEECNNLIN